MSAEPPLLAVRDLCIGFRAEGGRIGVVEGVSFEVGRQEIVGIVGESGSGKTVSALAVMGLIADPNAEITGSIAFEGRELLGLPGAALRHIRGKEIAMIFQDPMTALTPVYTIGWQIEEQIRAHGGPEGGIGRRAARARAVELLGEMGIPDPRTAVDRYPHQLSGGMRQRAMIAMALSCNPALLIADEPTTALDVTIQAQILRLLERLRGEFGSSVLLITHDMGVVAEVADRVMVMYAGRIAERGRTRDVFRSPGHPYTAGLLGSIPPMTGPKPRRLASIPGNPPSLARALPGCPFQPRCPARHARCRERPPLFVRGEQDIACWLPEERGEVIGVAAA